MELKQVNQLLSQNRTELSRHGVKSLAVFGSVARGEATESSDLDMLVEFVRPVGLFEFIRLKKFLEDLTGCKVDLVTQDALHPAMRDSTLKECKQIPCC
ncbi:MAG: nucleotidyltransferase family protein [Anaerolineae bacterium]|nr:nucleotidyltransferase family protein [Anaerolineae bacterium]